MEKPGSDGQKQITDNDLRDMLGSDSTSRAFTSQELLNAIRMIIMTDPEIIDNAMRYNLPSYRHCVAAASLWRKIKKHSATEAEAQLKLLLALMPSIKDQRIDKLVKAVIGQRDFERGEGSSMGDRFKQWATGK